MSFVPGERQPPRLPCGLPRDLEVSISSGLEGLHNSHNVSSKQRQSIYAALGPWQNREWRGRITAGHRRRARLALLSVYRVLPLVERILPFCRSRELLLLAENVLAGQDLSRVKLEFLLHGLDWSGQDPAAFKATIACYQPIGVAQDVYATIEQTSMAALRALEVVLFDEYNPLLYPGYSDDAAGWAQVAYREQAGISDPSQAEMAARYGDAYWCWWLIEAAPTAWFSTSED